MTFPSLDGDKKNRGLAVTGYVFPSRSSALFLPISPHELFEPQSPHVKEMRIIIPTE